MLHVLSVAGSEIGHEANNRKLHTYTECKRVRIKDVQKMGWSRSCCWLLLICWCICFCLVWLYVYLHVNEVKVYQSHMRLQCCFAYEWKCMTKSHRIAREPTCVRDCACILTFRFYYISIVEKVLVSQRKLMV